jgi:hypothetical protein
MFSVNVAGYEARPGRLINRHRYQRPYRLSPDYRADGILPILDNARF